MKISLFPYWLACGLWYAPAVAQAQATVSVGPKVGYNLSTTHFQNFPNSTTGYRSGLEVGLAGALGVGHLAIQVAALYSQKGYRQSITVPGDVVTGALYYDGNTRLDYLTVPVNIVFTQRRDGQGFQLYAGPYLSRLLGGRYVSSLFIDNGVTTIPGPPPTTEPRYGKVAASDHYEPNSDHTYAKRLDAGVQAGLGYQRGGWLLQAGYSLGLRNISEYEFAAGVGFRDLPYYNRAFQTSLTYLFQLQKQP